MLSGTVQPPTIWAGWEEELSAADEEPEDSAAAEEDSAEVEESAADDAEAALDDADADAALDDADEPLEVLAHPIRAKQAARAPMAIHTINRFIASPLSVGALHLPPMEDVQGFIHSAQDSRKN